MKKLAAYSIILLNLLNIVFSKSNLLHQMSFQLQDVDGVTLMRSNAWTAAYYLQFHCSQTYFKLLNTRVPRLQIAQCYFLESQAAPDKSLYRLVRLLPKPRSERHRILAKSQLTFCCHSITISVFYPVSFLFI